MNFNFKAWSCVFEEIIRPLIAAKRLKLLFDNDGGLCYRFTTRLRNQYENNPKRQCVSVMIYSASNISI